MLRRSALFALAMVLLTACGGSGGDAPTGPTATVVGAYSLQSVNGQNLPFTILQVGSDRLEVTASTLTLNADMSFTEVTAFRITESGVTSTETGTTLGTYTRTGNNLTFTIASNGGTYSAAWDGNQQITLVDQGFTLIYRK